MPLVESISTSGPALFWEGNVVFFLDFVVLQLLRNWLGLERVEYHSRINKFQSAAGCSSCILMSGGGNK